MEDRKNIWRKERQEHTVNRRTSEAMKTGQQISRGHIEDKVTYGGQDLMQMDWPIDI